MRCKHCRTAGYLEARGLCPRCYGDPAIRRRYPAKAPGGGRPAHGREPTMAELDALEKKMRPTMPHS